MRYRGYTARVEFDEDEGVLHGRVLGIRHVVTFEASSVNELEEEFHHSVDEYLLLCGERGIQPDREVSGDLVVRIDPDLQRRVTLAASGRQMSIDAWAEEALRTAVERERRSEAPTPALDDTTLTTAGKA